MEGREGREGLMICSKYVCLHVWKKELNEDTHAGIDTKPPASYSRSLTWSSACACMQHN